MKYTYEVEISPLRQRILEEQRKKQALALEIKKRNHKAMRLKRTLGNLIIGALVSAVMIGVALLGAWLDSGM